MKSIILISFLSLITLSYSQDIFKDLNGNKTNSTSSFQFSEAYYYDYILNSNNVTDSIYTKIIPINSPEGILTQKFNDKLIINAEKILNKLSLFSKINIEYNQIIFCIIKFKTIEENKISKIQLIVSKKENNIWKEFNGTNQIVEKLKLILYLKEEAFAQFEMSENYTKHPEINKLKPLVKDADGVLNIYKLSDIIQKNKTLLYKYLDE